MKKNRHSLAVFLKSLVVILAAGNLIALFVFNYRPPRFLRVIVQSVSGIGHQEEEETPTEDTAAPADDEPEIQLHVPSEPLVYDGSAELDLASGISVTDASGTEQPDIRIFTTIKAGTSRSNKIIEYSAKDSEGRRVTATRQLQLGKGYSGPSIRLQGELPTVANEDLPSLVSILSGDELLSADNGFGQDVTSQVVSVVKREADANGDTIVTLSITNMVQDIYSVDVSVHTGITGPTLRLTTDRVTLNVGDKFSFYDYIASAEDANGESLFRSIVMHGSVDTRTPGEYVLEFYCFNAAGDTSPTKTLTVTVK